MKKNIQRSKKIWAVALTVLCGLFLCLFAGGAFAAETPKYAEIVLPGEGVTDVENDALASREDFATETRGVLVRTKGYEANFSLANPVDMRAMTEEIPLLSFRMLAGAELARAKSVEITLTDSGDAANFIRIQYFPADGPGEGGGIHTYMKVVYRDRCLGLDRDGGVKVWENPYGASNNFGTYLSARSLWPDRFLESAEVEGETVVKGRTDSLNLYFDYFDRRVYGRDSNLHLVLDLDDPAHIGDFPWQGFSGDLARVSVSVTFDSNRAAGIYLTEFAGISLAGGQADMSVAPRVSLELDETYREVMPVSAKGIPYDIPAGRGWDPVFGVCETEISVHFGSSEVTGTTLEDSVFTPSEAGLYIVRYTAVNRFGNRGVKELEIRVLDALPAYSFVKSSADVPVFYQYFDVPEISVSGGSGTLEIEEEVRFAGYALDLSASRRIFIDRTGALQITLRVRGYTGSELTKSFVWLIGQEEPVLVIEEMPRAVVSGGTLSLPGCEVIDEDAEESEVSIFVNGTKIDGDTYSVSETPGAELEIVYSVRKGERTVTEDFRVAVIDSRKLSDFFLSEAEASVTSSGVLFSSETDLTADFAYPVAMSDLRISFGVASGNFSSVDVMLSDARSGKDAYFVRVSPRSSNRVGLQLNGLGIVTEIQGSLKGDYISLLFDNLSRTVCDGDGNVLFRPESLSKSACFVSFRVNGVLSRTDFFVRQISNQMFVRGNFDVTGDRSAPVPIFEEELPALLSIRKDTELRLPAAEAYDTLGGVPNVTLRVLYGGETLFSASAAASLDYVFDRYGTYTVVYEVGDDRNNSEIYQYAVKVIDTTTPFVTVTGIPASEYGVGENLVLPEITATDNSGEPCQTDWFLFDVNNYVYTVLDPEKEIALSQPGRFRLIAAVRDTSYNITRWTADFTVKE